jgi:protein translocase SecG subunit
MREVIQVLQSICAILLTIFILMQVRGTGFGRSANSASFTRRGAEKFIFKATFVVTAVFLILSVYLLVI